MSAQTTAVQVADLVRSLALGWKNLAAYPAGHPALVASLQLIERSVAELRGPASEVTLGIAADGIVYGTDKFDTIYARKFANALYGRGVAIVRFGSGTDLSDIETFLRLLGVGGNTESKTPIWEEITASGVMNINLQPVDYSAVQVTDNLDERVERNEASWLWDEILRALIADRELSIDAKQLLSQDVNSVDELAQLILHYVDALATKPQASFDADSTFGVRLGAGAAGAGAAAAEAIMSRVADTIGMSIAGVTGANRKVALQQVVQLLRVLPDSMRASVLRSVLRTLATDDTAAVALRDFTSELPQDEVLDALRHLATLTKLSSHALALLQSLTDIEKPVTAAPEVSETLMHELVSLFGEDDPDRFNPPDHKALLEDVSIQIPLMPQRAAEQMAQLGNRVDTIADEVVNRQLSRTLLDLLAAMGPDNDAEQLLMRLESTLEGQLRDGHFADALHVMRQLQEIALTTGSDALRDALHASYARLGSPEMIQTLIGSLLIAPPEVLPTIHQLIDALGSAATRSLLTALAEENNRSRRRKLFDFVASLGSVIVPEVVKLLEDQRWYVVRNMLALLRAVNDKGALAEMHRLARHPDLRVRLEAIKTLLAVETTLPRTLLEEVINDRDPKLAETAITLVGNYGIKEGVDPLLDVVRGRDIFAARTSIRIRAIKALGELAEPRALPRLHRFFTDSFLPWPAREERVAAYESLGSYPRDARSRLIEKGLDSRDPAVREICRKLAAD